MGQNISMFINRLTPAPDNLKIIINILMTILVIAQVILFINACTNLKILSQSQDYEEQLFIKHPSFQYFAGNNYMSADIFILLYDNPFCWLFIVIPFICLIIYLSSLRNESRSQFMEYNFFFIIILFWFILVAIVFGSIYIDITTNLIVNFQKKNITDNIEKLNIEAITGNDIKKQLVLNTIRYNIISQIENASAIASYNKESLKTAIIKYNSIKESEVDGVIGGQASGKTNIMNIIYSFGIHYRNNMKKDPNNININKYNLYINSIYKYFSLIDNTKDEKRIYNILGLADKNLTKDDNNIVKANISNFKDLLNDINNKFKGYYIFLIVLFIFYYAVLVISYRKEIQSQGTKIFTKLGFRTYSFFFSFAIIVLMIVFTIGFRKLS